MNYENTISRIRKFSGNANTVIKVMLVLILAAGALALISAVTTAKDLKAVPIVMNGTVTEMSTAPAFSEAVEWLMNCIILSAIMLTAHKMTSMIAHDGQPFRENTCKDLKRISMLLVLLAIVPPAVNIVLKMVFLPGGLVFGYLLNVQQIVYSVSDIITAVILFIVARVFEYGCGLQRESDETL